MSLTAISWSESARAVMVCIHNKEASRTIDFITPTSITMRRGVKPEPRAKSGEEPFAEKKIANSGRSFEPPCERDAINQEFIMAHVVTSKCLGCKFTDCVEVCPVACFYELEGQLVIHPEECIDCMACVDVCPVHAIYAGEEVPT